MGRSGFKRSAATYLILVGGFDRLSTGVTWAYHSNRPLLNFLKVLSPRLLFDGPGHTDDHGYWCDGKTLQFAVSVYIPVNEIGLLVGLLQRDREPVDWGQARGTADLSVLC